MSERCDKCVAPEHDNPGCVTCILDASHSGECKSAEVALTEALADTIRMYDRANRALWEGVPISDLVDEVAFARALLFRVRGTR